ncbi:uncharacterized protein LOC106071135 [Biomphalaria glabrata]|uniref:Uncharacterized protein LOC106071135 n=1 Tax=Biomphalaria glabrata TaxID=6526 RepID=A0A9U8EGN5_BIOGL|nr:uncharacterized protein LOC106071135 [Biomphalaria glabrata]
MCRRVHELLAPLLCVCVYCLRLLSETEALLASRVSNDTSNERFIFIDESESIRTHTDSQFVKAYNNFKTSKYPEIFIPIAIACLFFGALGNIGFFALFGNKLKRAYYTRDSLYFRFLATLDILVCLIVLPYAMFFEAERVTNNYVCKSMEYVRHFLTYMAHLGLLSYSFELPLRQGYTASKNHVRRAAYGIVILSAFCSIPVVFLFEINPIAFNNTLPPILYVKVHSDVEADFTDVYKSLEPRYCHMTLNLNTTWEFYDLMKYAEKMYYAINTLLYSAGLLLYVYKVILFIDARPLLGQDSIFIQTVIDVREGSFILPEDMAKQDKKRQSTTNPVYLRGKPSEEDLDDIDAPIRKQDEENKSSNNEASDVDTEKESSRPVENMDKDFKKYEENKSSKNDASDVDTKKEISRPVENMDKDFKKYEENKSSNKDAPDVDTKKESSRPVENLNKDFKNYEENKSSNNHAPDVDTKKESSRPVENLNKDFKNYEENKSSNNHAPDVDTKKESSRPVENLNKGFEKYEENKSSNNDASELDSIKKYRHPDQNQNSTSDLSQDRKVSFGDSMVNSITYSADESTKNLLRSDSKPKAPRPILKSQEKPSLKISSYKKSMMLLIFLDLLIITLTVIIDLAVKSSTTVLNFIHLKSVISFYLISLTNRDLRNATWGRYISCCNKIPSTSKRRIDSTAEPEFFGSNVRPELMKAWGRESYEGSDVTETSNVSGVSDIPTPVLLQDRSYGSSVSAKSSVIRT